MTGSAILKLIVRNKSLLIVFSTLKIGNNQIQGKEIFRPFTMDGTDWHGSQVGTQ